MHLKSLPDLKDPEQALFIGDSLHSDVRFAKMCGFQTLIVLSGGTKLEDITQLKSENERPDYVAYSMQDFNEILA